MAPAAGSADATELIYGLHAVREALRAGLRPVQRLLVLRADKQFADLVHSARARGIPVHVEPPPVFDRLVPDGRHQGVVAVTAAKAYVDVDRILHKARSGSDAPFLVILDGVEDPHNLGAVLRVAECAGVHGVCIPERRAVGLTPAVAKASAGAVDHIMVGRVTNIVRTLETVKAAGLWVYGLAPQATTLYTSVDFRGPLALVLGGEGKGIRPGVLGACDERIAIPMRGWVRSLNVAAAAAVVMYEVVRQRAHPRAERSSI